MSVQVLFPPPIRVSILRAVFCVLSHMVILISCSIGLEWLGPVLFLTVRCSIKRVQIHPICISSYAQLSYKTKLMKFQEQPKTLVLCYYVNYLEKHCHSVPMGMGPWSPWGRGWPPMSHMVDNPWARVHFTLAEGRPLGFCISCASTDSSHWDHNRCGVHLITWVNSPQLCLACHAPHDTARSIQIYGSRALHIWLDSYHPGISVPIPQGGCIHYTVL